MSHITGAALSATLILVHVHARAGVVRTWPICTGSMDFGLLCLITFTNASDCLANPGCGMGATSMVVTLHPLDRWEPGIPIHRLVRGMCLPSPTALIQSRNVKYMGR